MAMGLQLQETLTAAFIVPASGHLELMAAAWPVLATKETDRVFALFFEANGLAAVRREPYRDLVPTLVQAWIDWASGFIRGEPKRRRVEAENAIALLDGLLLLRQLAGPAAADRVAANIGIA